jgi:hypothetical protein
MAAVLLGCRMRPVELGACKGVDSPYRPQVYRAQRDKLAPASSSGTFRCVSPPPLETCTVLTISHGPGETVIDLRGMLGMSLRLRFAGGLLGLASGAAVLAAATPSSAAVATRQVVHQVHAIDRNVPAVCKIGTQSARQDINYRVMVR